MTSATSTSAALAAMAIHHVHRQPGQVAVPVVIVHGTGGRGIDELTATLPIAAAALTRNVLLIAPTFAVPYHFCIPGLDQQLNRFVDGLGPASRCTRRMILVGLSGGAQFVHRYAWRHPDRVAALFVQAAGCWTLPDGTPIGMMVDEDWWQRPEWSGPQIQAEVRKPARAGWERIRYYVGCGTEDHPSRIASTARFAEALRQGGATVEHWTYPAGHTVPEPISRRIWTTIDGLLTSGVAA